MTALRLGIDPYTYISQLPVQHLRELHITGIQHDGARWRDSMPMSAEDWAVAEWALAKIRQGEWPEPWVVALEYGGVGPTFSGRTDPDILALQVPRLCSLVRPGGPRPVEPHERLAVADLVPLALKLAVPPPGRSDRPCR